ncbi:N-acetylglucosamine-6-phosphate deacetylase [Frondihabitans cladoniiphilus]|uniref:N-acetylglucosamine-6-phosphate deacetylase n=1 Tax=Frondihabitans cladoniiphilus TaxID=715785 RepID=A0ABP8VVY3_9MICO
MTTLITGATKVDARGVTSDFWMLVDGPVITATGTGSAGAPTSADVSETVDAQGAFLTPGLIDLHAHGGGGHAFDDGTAEIEAALRTHRAHGTTRSLISLVANPLALLHRSLDGIADLAESDPLVLGAHLEGPFLSPDNRGAHHPDHLAVPDAATVAGLLTAARGHLRVVTMAPELPHALDAVGTFREAGVVVGVGHTQADHDLARAAFERGATLLTHAFNAMPGIHHRAPGPVVAAIEDERVVLELILDGVHVHPAVVALAFSGAPDRIALVTDAMAAAGAPDGDYQLGALDVTVVGGRAVLTGTETIAGSTLTQDVALRLAVSEARLSPRDAVTALTRTPARVLGLDDRMGTVAPGHVADLVLWDSDWRVQRVWADGAVLSTLTP